MTRPSLFILIIDMVCFVCTVSEFDNVKIDFTKKPVIFGKPAEMFCRAEGTEIPINESSKSWDGGPNNTLLSKDGISANKQKYEEKMGKDKFHFNLLIYNFSELDVDCSYSCTSGVDSTSKKFDLNEEDYQYAMTPEMIHISSEVRNMNFEVDIYFRIVWPTPICDISFEGIHYANKTSTSKTLNGKLYSVLITFKQTLRTHSCSSKMIVSCQIGTQHIVFPSVMLDKCSVTDHNIVETASYSRVIVIIIVVGMALFPVVMCIVKQKKKKHIPVKIFFRYTEIRHKENGSNRNNEYDNLDDPIDINSDDPIDNDSNSDQLSSNVNQT